MSIVDVILIITTSALGVAIATWIAGRALRPSSEESQIAEQFQQHRVRTALIAMIATIAVPLGWQTVSIINPNELTPSPTHLAFAVFLFIINIHVVALADFSMRRRIFNEGDSFGIYARNLLQTIWALFGFFVLSLFVPFLITMGHPYEWVQAIILFLVMMTWSRCFPQITAFIIQAKPVNQPELNAEFKQVIDRSEIESAQVLAFGTDKSTWCNAFALPSTKKPTVIITTGLLRLMNTAESTAIFAHEVAHLEDFRGKKLKKLRIAEDVFIILATAFLPLISLWKPTIIEALLWLWIPFVILYNITRIRGMKSLETASDLRGAELSNNPDALISALTKLHAANGVPRQLDPNQESLSTHPSLANRIKSIREKFNLSAPEATPPFSEEVSPPKNKTTIFSPSTKWVQYRIASFISGIAGFLASFEGALGTGTCIWLLLGSLPILISPKRTWLAAAGSMAIMTALTQTVFNADHDWWSPNTWFYITLVGLCGVFCLIPTITLTKTASNTPSKETGSAIPPILYYGLIGVSIFLIQLISTQGPDLLPKLYAWGVHSPSTFLPILALGAALLQCKKAWPKIIGIPLCLIGCAHLYLGSEKFLTEKVNDPLMADLNVEIIDFSRLPTTSIDIPAAQWGLWPSPNAKRFYTVPRHNSTQATQLFSVHTFEGDLTEIAALAIAFVNDEELLTLISQNQTVTLQHISLPQNKTILWSLPLPQLKLDDDLKLHCDGNQWKIVANPSRSETKIIQGTLGNSAITEQTYYQGAPENDHYRYTANTSSLLNIDWNYAKQGEPFSWQRIQHVLHSFYSPTELGWLKQNQLTPWLSSILAVDCKTAPLSSNTAILMAYAPRRIICWSIDFEKETKQPLFALNHFYHWAWNGQQVAVLEPYHLMVFDSVVQKGIRMRLDQDANWDVSIAWAKNQSLLIAWPNADYTQWNVHRHSIPTFEESIRTSKRASATQ